MKIRGGPSDATLSNACLENKKNGIRDLSILQKPIQTSITGFKEVVKAYKDGTEEIKLLLSNECDIIYECKACRNIFRSLANFISHKRTYCTTNFNSSQHFHFRQNDQDIATIIEHSDAQSNSKETKEHVRDLGSIIDRLMRREQTSQVITLSDLYDQASQNLTQDEVIKKKQILQLDKMVNSDVAVYQTLKKEDGDSIKKEVNEIHDMFENVQTVLGPDGKVSGGGGNTAGQSIALKTESMRFSCKICSRKFITEKMLKLHIKAKHIPSTNVYPCNACPRTFLLPAGLIRHLNNDHKKPMRRIRLMREAIFKRRTRKDEVQSKGPNRELSRLQNGNREPTARSWQSDNIEKIKVSSICIFCAKSFERRAALITHTKNCAQRGKHSISNGHANNEDEDDDNVDKSVQSFMAMLKREKEIQANVQKCIDEEEDQLIEENSSHGNDSSAGLGLDVNKNDSEEVTVVKNKRKRHIVQKVDQPTADDIIGNSTWHMDDSDHVNGSVVENDAASAKPSEKKKKKKMILEKTTDCTMCPKKFTNISNLRRHVAMLHYRQKTFGCKLCDYKAFRKIDIINHLGVCHHIGGEPDVCSELVVNIQIDSNKFNDEKIKAVAPALNKIEQELLSQSNETDRIDTVDTLNGSDSVVHPIICNETISSGSNSNSPDKSTNASDSKENSSSEKLKKRGRRLKVKQSNATEGRTISQNSSSESLPDCQPSQMNRPVRNRVKIMNKDFVYDLSNLLRKEAVVYKEQLIPIVIKNPKRKLSQTAELSSSSREKDEPVELLPKKLSPVDCIAGSANTMAQQAIDSFRACSSKPPELPSERPIVPAKIIQMRRSTNGIHNWNAVHSEDGSNRQSSSDKLFEALANKNRLFEASTVIGNGTDMVPEQAAISPTDETVPPLAISSCLSDKSSDQMFCSNELVCQQLVVNNLTDPNNAFLVSTQTESLPTNGNSKRITLLQRLMEINQSKKKGN
ncbi:zinc finger protein 800 [Bradysia coprophila]|uniref:zinc finger protein 800 n=1 Tax=Bradysia coprophila TaxID=38358 RepID=UPI00187DC6A3|nr:zinc finger protein 800 [Bradysia coprophila]XP_037029905.1 zinc finger protein 800 [Bradysia coprophila]XP_037029906.1 zinc finger protein 800 [Bradysia coprophila]